MKNTFELGLCMAGAVSAGAYTAGVMDFLIEALQTWEDNRGKPDVPNHRVLLKAIGGASAGGMTGIIASSALNNPITPVTKADQDNIFKKNTDNKFYQAWVDQIQDDMFPLMLSNDDIESGKIYSLLNSTFIDKIGETSIRVKKDEYIERKYIDNKLKLFTTLTNLEGFKYSTNFQGDGNQNEYHLSHHADYATFQLNTTLAGYKNDGWMPLDFFKDINTQVALDAAKATGAFPIGLKSRKISREVKYVNDLEWNHPLLKKFPVSGNTNGLYEALIIDGGTINNEPFQKVSSMISGIHHDENKFSGTTLMIDPFPSYSGEFDINKDGVSSIMGKSLGAMLNHLRSKPDVILKTIDSDDVSRFQIAPVRYQNKKRIEGSKAIACGFLGGFGGFLHKEFRIHDFYLGRANCEHFLRKYFVVSETTSNPIFKQGYKNSSKSKFVNNEGKRQIIPIFKPADTEMYMPVFQNGSKWPKRHKEDITRFKKQIRRRAGKMVMNASDYNWSSRLLLGIGNRILLRRMLANNITKTILKSMEQHDLLK
jgi:hypothetical protein